MPHRLKDPVNRVTNTGGDRQRGSQGDWNQQIDPGESGEKNEDGNDLKDGRQFADHVWMHVQPVNPGGYQKKSDNQNQVATDHDDGEPNWKCGRFCGQEDQCRYDQSFVGDRIKNRAGSALLIVSSGNVTIDPVGRGCDQEKSCSQPSKTLIRTSKLDSPLVSKRRNSEQRNEANPRDSNLVGKRHREIVYIRLRITSGQSAAFAPEPSSRPRKLYRGLTVPVKGGNAVQVPCEESFTWKVKPR
jgi:hypothetical protein